MRILRCVALVLVCLLSLAACVLSWQALERANRPAQGCPECEGCKPSPPGREIECDRLTIKSKDGKHSLTLVGKDTSVGLYVSARGRVAAIVSRDWATSPWIGLHDTEADTPGCAWAIQLDEKGNPLLMTIVDGKIKHTTPGKP